MLADKEQEQIGEVISGNSMNRPIKLFYGLFLAGLLITIISFKYSAAQGTSKQLLLGGTVIYSYIFRSDISIVMLLVFSFYLFIKLVNSVAEKQIMKSTLFSVAALFTLLLPGHFVVTECNGNSMREYLYFVELKRVEINDPWIGDKISGGYERTHHYNSEYSCFRYCDSFFIRKYQVGKNEMFSVLNGIGPLFNLEDETFYKN